VLTYQPGAGEIAELWVVSSAGPRTDIADPKRLVHGEILFSYFADATPVVATCNEAEGRITLATDLPCGEGFASRTTRPAPAMPPYLDLCYGGGWCSSCD